MKTSFQWTFDKQNYSRFSHFKLTWLSWPFSSPPILPRHWCQGSSSLVIKCQTFSVFSTNWGLFCWGGGTLHWYFPHDQFHFLERGNTIMRSIVTSPLPSAGCLLIYAIHTWTSIIWPEDIETWVKLWTISLWQVVLGLSNSFSPIGTRTLGASTLHES